jgi:hypothetical protein
MIIEERNIFRCRSTYHLCFDASTKFSSRVTPHPDGVGATSACLRDLPTPAEARASRRREPLRQRQVALKAPLQGTLPMAPASVTHYLLVMHRMLRNALKQKAILMENQQFQCQVWFFAPVVVNCSDLSGIEYT